MSSLALYRTLIPEHAGVADDTVTTFLALAARRHTASRFGALYAEAMVWWAAHRLQHTPGMVSGGGTADEVGIVTSQRDGDLSRTYAQPSEAAATGGDAELRTTRYGLAYLDIRNSRAAAGPGIVGAACR